jgi:hypothetical protein
MVSFVRAPCWTRQRALQGLRDEARRLGKSHYHIKHDTYLRWIDEPVGGRRIKAGSRSLPLSMFVSSGQRYLAPRLPEHKAQSRKSDQHHRPG